MIINEKSKRIIKLAKQYRLYVYFRIMLQCLYSEIDKAKAEGRTYSLPSTHVLYKFFKAVKYQEDTNLINILQEFKRRIQPTDKQAQRMKEFFLYRPMRNNE